jgi:uncharacterized protein
MFPIFLLIIAESIIVYLYPNFINLMHTGIFSESSNFTKFIFILFSILIGFTIFMFIGFATAIPLFGASIGDLTANVKTPNPANIALLKYLQAVYSIGLFVFPPLMVAYFFSNKVGEFLKMDKMPFPLSILIVSLIMVFALPLINYLMILNESIKFPPSLAGLENQLKYLENQTQELSKSFLKADTFSIYIANMFVMAIIPAIGEEFLFRGVFQRLFKDWTRNIHIAIWLTAFIFSAMHFQFYGFIPRMILGAFFGYLLYWSGNLWMPIIAHFVNNSIAVTVFYLNNNIAYKVDKIGASKALSPELITSTLAVGLLIYIFVRIEKERIRNNQIIEVKKTNMNNE